MDTTDAPQIIEHVHKSVTFTPYDTRWVPSSARFVVLGIHPKATGALQVFELNSGEANIVQEAVKPKGIKCGTFGASGLEDRHLATGDYDGMLNIWYCNFDFLMERHFLKIIIILLFAHFKGSRIAGHPSIFIEGTFFYC